MKKFILAFLPCLATCLAVMLFWNWVNEKPQMLTAFNAIFAVVMSILITTMSLRAANTDKA